MIISPLRRLALVGGRCASLLMLLVVCVCFTALSVAAQQESPPARVSSVVRGRVVYEDTGKPMRFARVFLSAEKNRQRPRITSTDARGEFTFHNVAAGSYLASVFAPDVYGSNNYPTAPEGGEAVQVDGAAKVELKLRGARGGSITGKITYADGEPVVAARLILLRALGEQWQGVGQCCTGGPMTDDRGVYRLYGLPPGEYKVGVAEEGLQVESDENGGMSSSYNQALITFYYPSVVGAETATSVKVTPGRTVEGVDIAVPDVRTHAISGTLLLGGQPLPGASLSLQWDNSTSYAPGHKMTFADAEGKWTFKSVPDGNFTISPQPGVMLRDGGDPEKVARLRKAIGESRKVTVAGADLEGVTITMSEGGAITGTVSVEGGGALPQHMSLTTTPADETARRTGNDRGRGQVEMSGSFRIEGVRPGEVFVDLEGLFPSGYHYVKSITRDGHDLIRTPLRMPEGGEIKGVRITLATGMATLSGRIATAEGGQQQQPTGPCGVLLVPADSALWGRRWSYLWAEVNPEGKFSAKGAPGEYLLWLNPKFRSELTQYIKDHAQSAQRVTLRTGEETKLELSQRCEKEEKPKQ
jgi:hypothetical protein